MVLIGLTLFLFALMVIQICEYFHPKYGNHTFFLFGTTGGFFSFLYATLYYYGVV